MCVSMLKFYMFIFLYTGLSRKTDPDLSETSNLKDYGNLGICTDTDWSEYIYFDNLIDYTVGEKG